MTTVLFLVPKTHIHERDREYREFGMKLAEIVKNPRSGASKHDFSNITVILPWGNDPTMPVRRTLAEDVGVLEEENCVLVVYVDTVEATDKGVLLGLAKGMNIPIVLLVPNTRMPSGGDHKRKHNLDGFTTEIVVFEDWWRDGLAKFEKVCRTHMHLWADL